MLKLTVTYHIDHLKTKTQTGWLKGVEEPLKLVSKNNHLQKHRKRRKLCHHKSLKTLTKHARTQAYHQSLSKHAPVAGVVKSSNPPMQVIEFAKRVKMTNLNFRKESKMTLKLKAHNKTITVTHNYDKFNIAIENKNKVGGSVELSQEKLQRAIRDSDAHCLGDDGWLRFDLHDICVTLTLEANSIRCAPITLSDITLTYEQYEKLATFVLNM